MQIMGIIIIFDNIENKEIVDMQKAALVATRIEAQNHDRLKDIADEQDRTIAYLVRKAVGQYVDTQQQKEKKHKAA